MNQHHAAAARETLLRLFLDRLEDAVASRDNGCITMRVSGDTAAIVVDSLRRALNGQSDPFSLRPPRGIKPTLDRAQWHLLAATVAFLADDCAIDVAFKKAATAFKIVSPGSARDAFYEVVGGDAEWGRLLVHQWRPQIEQLLDGVPVSRITA